MFAKRKSLNNKSKKRKHLNSINENNNENDSINNISEIEAINKTIQSRSLNQFSTEGMKKKEKANGIFESLHIQSTKEIIPQQYSGDATYELQIDTSIDRDNRAILERNIKLNKSETIHDESGKIYKGQAAYKNYIAKNEEQIGKNKYTGTQGPIRATTWARAISRFDYQPDICKDYKETGFCGYGDSCKFLHDRGDYKSGWQIEKEFNEKQKLKQKRLLEKNTKFEGDDSSDDDKYVIDDNDDEQFACTICRKPFVDAIETICGHFFCEKCALKRYKKTSRCFNCNKQTNGVFNAALKYREKEAKHPEKYENTENIKLDGTTFDTHSTKKEKGTWSKAI